MGLCSALGLASGNGRPGTEGRGREAERRHNVLVNIFVNDGKNTKMEMLILFIIV